MLKLMQGDCLELMQDIPDKSIDLILTDPPLSGAIGPDAGERR
jgi:DNA modification methylase